MRMRLLAAAVVLCFAANASARALKPTSFRAEYVQIVENEELQLLKSCAAAARVDVVDARMRPDVGSRFHEEQPEKRHSVSFSGDAREWAESGISNILRSALLRIDDTRPVITIKLADVWVEEKIFKRAEYDGRVVLEVTVRGNGATSDCFSERFVGRADNYGYAGKEENYQETVNHALDRAVTELVASPAFSAALCACGSATQIE